MQAIGDVRLALEGTFEMLDGTSVEPAAVPRLALWQRPVPLMTGTRRPVSGSERA